MSNSALANYINRFSGNYTSRDEMIDKITIHIAHAAGDCYDLAEMLSESDNTSYHYGISTDGTIGLYVDEQYATYSTGSESNDQRAVNIIVMNDYKNKTEGNTDKTPASGGRVSSKSYDALIKLCVDICRRNYILKATYLPGDHDKSTLTMHRWFTKTDCPGDYLAGRYGSIASAINSQLTAARTASSETESLKSRSTITVGATSPFMVVPDDDALNVDYKGLKGIGVIGVMLHAGAYYDRSYNKYRRYPNQYLKSQIAEVKAADMHHALYATVRARNSAEAKLECYELYFVVSKYPPILGLWLNLDFRGLSRARAQEVVNVYYDRIVRWGLKGKCGFYCTKSMANLINWPEYTDRFALWLISPTSDVDNLEQVLTPSLFKL